MNVITNNKGMMLFLENKSDSFNEDTELLINIISNSNLYYQKKEDSIALFLSLYTLKNTISKSNTNQNKKTRLNNIIIIIKLNEFFISLLLSFFKCFIDNFDIITVLQRIIMRNTPS